jgi:hypothetical protein
MGQIRQIGGRWAGRGSAGPRALFLDGEPGVVLDFTDPQALYQDNIGASPLLLPNTAVGMAVDRSRARSPITLGAAAQVNSAFRPKWGRAPKVKRNLMALSGAAGFLTGADGTSSFDNAPTGFTAPVDAIFQRVTKAVSSTQFYGYRTAQSGASGVATVVSVHVIPEAGCSEIGMQTDSSSGFYMRLNLATGVVTKGANVHSAGATVLGGGAYRLWAKSASVVTTFVHAVVARTLLAGTAASFLVGGHQAEAAALTSYQKAASAFDMTEAGLPAYGYLRPDLSDDLLTATLALAQTGDVMIFGRNGSWYEVARNYGAGAAFSLGPRTVTGLTTGLLTALGDILAVVAVGRSLSLAERQMALSYYMERGAAGWLVVGTERLSNGGFPTDLTGWINDSGTARGTSTWVAGTVLLSNTGTGNMVMYQGVSTVIGRAYLASFDVLALTGTVTARLFAGTNATNGSNLVLIAPGVPSTNTGIFVATATTTYISAVAFGGSGPTVTFDNISLKSLEVV